MTGLDSHAAGKSNLDGPCLASIGRWSIGVDMSYIRNVSAFLLGAACIAGGPAFAQNAEDFYKSRSQLQMIVPNAPGGGYDSYARLLAKHMPKYIPGRPQFVVANMPGAGGITAANHLYNIAPKDGTTMGILDRGSPTAPLLYGAQSKGQFEAAKYAWIGSAMSERGMGVVSTAAPARTLDEVKKTEIFFGATGPETDPAMNARLLNELLGTKIRTITGYKGQPDQFLAVEKGEIHGLFMSGWSGPGRAFVREQIGKGKLQLLVQMAFEKDPVHPETPTILEVVKESDRPMVSLLLSRLELGRPFVAPPGVPADRVEILRTAFTKAMEDPELLAEAAAQKLAIGPMTGAAAQALVNRMYQTPPELLERVRKIVRVEG
jgi:tripartite-type tricarboxylate transporter receptor subunit TctC